MRIFLTMSCWLLVLTTMSAQGIPFLRNFSATEYHAHNQNFDVITGDDGTVYVANFEGLLYYDQANWRTIHTPGVNRITAVFRDSKGTVWAGGYKYIGYVETGAHGILRLHEIDPKNRFQGEVQWIWERNGKIQFLDNEKKIFSIVGKSVVLAAGDSLPSSGFAVLGADWQVTQVQQLDYGLKAVSTTGNGIIIVDSLHQELFRITEENGLSSNNVSHITYDRHGMLWAATDNGISAIAFPSVYTHFTKHEGLRGEVASIEMLGQHIYAGTLSGLFRLEGKRFVPVGNITHACWQLVRQGESLLAASASGIYRITSTGSVSLLTTASALSLMVDGQGFYSGEMDGVYYNTDGSREKICNIGKVVKIARDQQGVIWIQNLYGSLWKSVDGRTFKAYIPPNAQEEREIATLASYQGVLPVTISAKQPFPFPLYSYQDDDGNSWLTNNRGKKVYAFKDGIRQETLSELVYPLMDYSVRAMKSDKKLLWLGGDRGINILDMEHEDPLRNCTPRLFIRSVSLRGDSVLWGGYGTPPAELPELASDERHVIFHFSIDHPSMLLQTQYRTRLDNGNWSAWEFLTYEEYNNLTYGSHLFEVQGRDAFGHTTQIVTMRFSITAPLYRRWYMLLLYLVLAGALIACLVQLRLYQLARDKWRLEHIVKERTAEVVRLERQASVGKLTQGLIDRIINPLNYINNFAKLSEGLVKDVVANVEEEKEHMDADNYEDTIDVLDMLTGNLQKVGEHGANTTRTLKAMEEMLKDRTGGITKIDLVALFRQDEEILRNYYEKDIKRDNIAIHFDYPTGELYVNGNAEQLSKTFMSLLANAIYAVSKQAQRMQEAHNDYQPEVILRAVPSGKQVEVVIRDNGIGIEEQIIGKIFDPFFTTKTTAEAAGVGLYLSREIVQSLGGDISVTSEKYAYTEFTITLPTL